MSILAEVQAWYKLVEASGEGTSATKGGDVLITFAAPGSSWETWLRVGGWKPVERPAETEGGG